jgi:hypothetical protein
MISHDFSLYYFRVLSIFGFRFQALENVSHVQKAFIGVALRDALHWCIGGWACIADAHIIISYERI